MSGSFETSPKKVTSYKVMLNLNFRVCVYVTIYDNKSMIYDLNLVSFISFIFSYSILKYLSRGFYSHLFVRKENFPHNLIQ